MRNLPEMLLMNVALVNWALCFSMCVYFASVSMCSSYVFLKFLSLEFCFPLPLLFTSKMVSTALSSSRVSVLDDTYGSQNSSCTDGSSFALGTCRIIYPHSPDLKDDHMTCFCQWNVRGKKGMWHFWAAVLFCFFCIGNSCIWKFPIDTWGLDYNLYTISDFQKSKEREGKERRKERREGGKEGGRVEKETYIHRHHNMGCLFPREILLLLLCTRSSTN